MNPFKSIIFFNITHDESRDLKQHLSTIQSIKVFNTTTADEVQQIVGMSGKSALICDDNEAITLLKKDIIDTKKHYYRQYLINWDNDLTNAERQRICELNITVLRTNNHKAVLDKLELYLFGKINMFQHNDTKKDIASSLHDQLGHKFFTLLELRDQDWQVVISSHERENSISSVLGKNWDSMIETIISTAPTIIKPIENNNSGSPYYEIITPHIKDGVVTRISIVHLPRSTELGLNIDKVKAFLKVI